MILQTEQPPPQLDSQVYRTFVCKKHTEFLNDSFTSFFKKNNVPLVCCYAFFFHQQHLLAHSVCSFWMIVQPLASATSKSSKSKKPPPLRGSSAYWHAVMASQPTPLLKETNGHQALIIRPAISGGGGTWPGGW